MSLVTPKGQVPGQFFISNPFDADRSRDPRCIGEEQFRKELLEQMGKKLGAHHGGGERIETARAKAERIVAEEMARRGWRGAELEKPAKPMGRKSKSPGDYGLRQR